MADVQVARSFAARRLTLHLTIPGGDVAQLVRACGSYPQCRRFDSYRRHQSFLSGRSAADMHFAVRLSFARVVRISVVVNGELLSATDVTKGVEPKVLVDGDIGLFRMIQVPSGRQPVKMPRSTISLSLNHREILVQLDDRGGKILYLPLIDPTYTLIVLGENVRPLFNVPDCEHTYTVNF